MLTTPEEYEIRMMVKSTELIGILLDNLFGKIRFLTLFNYESGRYYVIYERRESAVVNFIIIHAPSELS